MTTGSARHTTGLLSPVAFGAGLLLLALSPLIRGGNRHVALIGLEWLALLCLSAVAWRWAFAKSPGHAAQEPSGLSATEISLLCAPAVIGLIQCLPWPPFLLTGQRPWAATSMMAFPSSMSVAPDLTLTALLAALPVAAAYLLGRLSSERQTFWMVKGLLCLAGMLALWGLAQQTHWGEWLFFDAEFAGAAIGPFANHNHFANWLLMLLPLAAWQIRVQFSERSLRGADWLALMGWAGLAMVMLAALVASASRSGVGIALPVLLLAAGLLWWKPGKFARHKWTLLGGLLLMGALLWLIADPGGLVGRLGSAQLADDAGLRWKLTLSTWDAALSYLPWGSGLGTYAVAYPAFQPPAMGASFPHAHNDYVQYWMELGLFFPVVLWLLWRVMRPRWAEWVAWLPHRKRPQACLFQGMCWVGFVGMALHSWVDFNFRIPANAMLAALLLGMACRPMNKPLHAPHASSEESEQPTPIIPGRKPHRHRRNWLKRIRKRFGLD